MREPKLTGKKERPFTLTGNLIDLFSKNRKLQRVIARANATAVSDSMTLTSDTIDLRVKNDLLDHAYAWGMKSRARARCRRARTCSPIRSTCTCPDSKVRLVRALRKAFARGQAGHDALQASRSPTRHDWLRGDTIIAHFDTRRARRTRRSRRTSNSSFALGPRDARCYHLAPSDTAERRPAINYVIARTHHDRFRQAEGRHGDGGRFGVSASTSSRAPTRRRRAAPTPAQGDAEAGAPTEAAAEDRSSRSPAPKKP